MLINRSAATSARDAGISLVEVFIAMVLSVIVGSILVSYLISSVNHARRADGQNEQAAGARTVLDSWTSLVPLAVDPNGESGPGAVRFFSIAPRSARFCAATGTKSMVVGAVDAPPIGVELALIGDDLVEKRYATCAAMVTGGSFVRRILVPRAALAADGAWLLRPLARADLKSNAVTAGLLPSTIAPGQQPLLATVQADSEKIALIAGVQLAFQTLPAPGRAAPPATYTSLLSLNAGG
jgi:hypothetical protein